VSGKPLPRSVPQLSVKRSFRGIRYRKSSPARKRFHTSEGCYERTEPRRVWLQPRCPSAPRSGPLSAA